MKINHLNQILPNWYYRKFIELQNQINQSLHSGEFFEMSREFQNKMIDRLKFLYNKMAHIIETKKIDLAEAVKEIGNITTTGLISRVNMGLAVGRISSDPEIENDRENNK